MKYLIAPHLLYARITEATGLNETEISVYVLLYYHPQPISKDQIMDILAVGDKKNINKQGWLQQALLKMKTEGSAVAVGNPPNYSLTSQGIEKVNAIQSVLHSLKHSDIL